MRHALDICQLAPDTDRHGKPIYVEKCWARRLVHFQKVCLFALSLTQGFHSMAHLRRVLQEMWRSARPTFGTTGQQLPRISSKSFLKTSDEWATIQQDAAMKRVLEAEKSATESFFAPSADFQSRFHEEVDYLMPNEEMVPEEQGSFMYFQRPNADGFLEYGRFPLGQPQAEHVFLNTGELAAETGYADVTACKVSEDDEVLAYIADLHGDDSYELHLRNLREPGKASQAIRIPGIRSVEFLGRTGNVASLLAVKTDESTKRAHQALHLTLADGQVRSRLLWNEDNPAAYLELFKTKDRQFVLVSSNTKDTSKVRIAKCQEGNVSQEIQLVPLLEPMKGVEYFAEHHGRMFVVISNHERPDFAVYKLPEEKLGHSGAQWTDLQLVFLPPGAMHVTDADMFSRWLVLYGHDTAAPRICVVPHSEDSQFASTCGTPRSGAAYLVALPSIGSIEPGVNAGSNAETIRFTFRSPVEPGRLHSLNLSSGETRLINAGTSRTLDALKIAEHVQCDRLNFAARDGELVPLTLVRPQEAAPSPCLLHVYGAYGSCLTPDFRPEHIALLRRGWVLAWAHVRGGGERGSAWHSAGRQQQKARSVLDLADAARFLLARGIAVPGAICLKGSSAGGFALGSFLNSREDAALVGAAILEVPFVDVLTGMLDPSLPLTAHEFAEWGDPSHPEHEENIRSLSPYENIGSHNYPPIYISCALADARVPAWMAVKYAARCRTRTPGFIRSSTGRLLDRKHI